MWIVSRIAPARSSADSTSSMNGPGPQRYTSASSQSSGEFLDLAVVDQADARHRGGG